MFMLRKPSYLPQKLLLFLLCGGILLLCVHFRLPCPIRTLLGFPCPGCGLSRAWLAALRLDFAAALRFYPLFWLIPLLALFILFDFRLFPGKKLNTLLPVLMLIAVSVQYVLRLVRYFMGRSGI